MDIWRIKLFFVSTQPCRKNRNRLFFRQFIILVFKKYKYTIIKHGDHSLIAVNNPPSPPFLGQNHNKLPSIDSSIRGLPTHPQTPFERECSMISFSTTWQFHISNPFFPCNKFHLLESYARRSRKMITHLRRGFPKSNPERNVSNERIEEEPSLDNPILFLRTGCHLIKEHSGESYGKPKFGLCVLLRSLSPTLDSAGDLLWWGFLTGTRKSLLWLLHSKREVFFCIMDHRFTIY